MLSILASILFILAFVTSHHQHSQSNTIIINIITAEVSLDLLSYNHHSQLYTSDIESWEYLKKDITIDENDENIMRIFEQKEKRKERSEIIKIIRDE